MNTRTGAERAQKRAQLSGENRSMHTPRGRDLRRRLREHPELDLGCLPIRNGHRRADLVQEIVDAVVEYERERAYALLPRRSIRLGLHPDGSLCVRRGETGPNDSRSPEMRRTQDADVSQAVGDLLLRLLAAFHRHVLPRRPPARLHGREYIKSYLPQILDAAEVAPPRYCGHRRTAWTVAAVERGMKRAMSRRRSTLRHFLEQDDERWRDLRDRCDDPKMRAALDRAYVLPSPAGGRERVLQERSTEAANKSIPSPTRP